LLYRLGRLLQLLGLLMLPLALAGNLAELAGAGFRLTLVEMLLMCALGVLVFYIGWSLQAKAMGR
jgi:hypothetical protein